MEKLIKERLNNYLELIDEFFKTIEEFDRIAIFRHEKPDYDALGSQMGLVSFIKDNFPKQEVIYVGDEMVGLNEDCFPKMCEIDEKWFNKKFLDSV